MANGADILAFDYLGQALGARAPGVLTLRASFGGSPLEGEGRIALFSFEADLSAADSDLHWVAAGETAANYYPDWGLSADEMYSVHLGTRFMLVMGVLQVPESAMPEAGEIRSAVEELFSRVAPGETIEAVEPAALFGVDEERHLVLRVRVAGEEVYVLTMDCPAGIYREVQLSPHVVYRRHLGQLIRREMAEAPDIVDTK